MYHVTEGQELTGFLPLNWSQVRPPYSSAPLRLYGRTGLSRLKGRLSLSAEVSAFCSLWVALRGADAWLYSAHSHLPLALAPGRWAVGVALYGNSLCS